jgi:hypothetical protein
VPAPVQGEQLKEVVVDLARRRAWTPVTDSAEIVPMRPADAGRGRDRTEAPRYPRHVPVYEVRVRVEVNDTKRERGRPTRWRGPAKGRRNAGAVARVAPRDHVARPKRRTGKNKGYGE